VSVNQAGAWPVTMPVTALLTAHQIVNMDAMRLTASVLVDAMQVIIITNALLAAHQIVNMDAMRLTANVLVDVMQVTMGVYVTSSVVTDAKT
jgi:hypothetical protein